MKPYRSYLVTGGAGFIGSHLAKRLKEMGREVTVLDVVPNCDAEPRLEHGIRYVQGSVTDRKIIAELVAEHDCTFHLAALLGVKRTMDQPAEMIENNLTGTIHVLKTAQQFKKRVVFASSSEVYGKSKPPFREDSDPLYGPSIKLRWSYATAKSLEESLCLSYTRKGAAVSIVRYFNVYGPRQKSGPYGGAIPKFITAALQGKVITVYGDGKQTRCFTYVSDAVEATIAASQAQAVGEVINIGDEKEITIADLAQTIKLISKSASKIVNIPYEQVYPVGFEEIPRRLPDTTKLRSLLHFEPRIDLHHGLVHTIDWYQKKENAG